MYVQCMYIFFCFRLQEKLAKQSFTLMTILMSLLAKVNHIFINRFSDYQNYNFDINLR
jgi:hypothetical protein